MKNTTVLLFIFLFLGLFSSNIYSQVTQQWLQIYPSGDWTYPKGIGLDKFGNIYVCFEKTTTTKDIVTLKYSTSGEQLWHSIYGEGYSQEFVRDMEVDENGNVIITGRISHNFNGDTLILLKYDTYGNLKWDRKYTDSLINTNGLACTSDKYGNVYVTGFNSDEQFSYVMITIKYDSLGNRKWVSKYRGPLGELDHGRDIVVDDSGYVYVGGRSKGIGTSYDFITIKYNSQGIEQWNARYNGPAGTWDDLLQFIALDSMRNVYVVGQTRPVDLHIKIAILKYDNNGVLQWLRIPEVSEGSSESAYGMKVDKPGNVYITGGSTGWGQSFECTTMKYNSMGDSLWVINFPRNNYSIGQDIDLDDSGNVYIAGWTTVNSGQGNYDALTIKYNTVGQFQWYMQYNSGSIQSNDRWQHICVDSVGSSIYCFGTNHHYKVATIKYYSPIVKVESIKNITIKDFKLHQNLPNPFNPLTNIRFDIPKSNHVKIIIYNALGKEIATLVNEKLSAGSYETDWDGTGYPSGVYFYRIQAGDFIETKSMVLVK